jgi:hypothetical protein
MTQVMWIQIIHITASFFLYSFPEQRIKVSRILLNSKDLKLFYTVFHRQFPTIHLRIVLINGLRWSF